MNMLNEKPMQDTYDENEKVKMDDFIFHIFEKGNRPFNKDPRKFAKRMSIDNLSRKEKIMYFLKK